jgi:hypothetical protein
LILPSPLAAPTTETVGLFETTPGELGRWLVDELDAGWEAGPAPTDDLATLVEPLRPVGRISRYLLVPLDGWTAVLNDARLGTDLGMIPSLAARKLGRRAIRAVAAAGGDGRYPATILEVYDPEADDNPLRSRRTLFAANDGGTWRFGESGERFDFEEPEAYGLRRIRDRFTPPMLDRYLAALGLPAGDAPDPVEGAVVVEDRGLHLDSL